VELGRVAEPGPVRGGDHIVGSERRIEVQLVQERERDREDDRSGPHLAGRRRNDGRATHPVAHRGDRRP